MPETFSGTRFAKENIAKRLRKENFPEKEVGGLYVYVCYYLAAAVSEISNDHNMILAAGSCTG